MKPSWPPFIPKALDDAGFTPVEHRIICRVCRRGDCWESLAEIARGCRVNYDTAVDALKRLVKWGVIEKKSRKGQPSIYTLNQPEEWQIEPPGNKRGGCMEIRGEVDHTEKRGPNHTETRGDKGSPLRDQGKKSETIRFETEDEFPQVVTAPVYR